MTTQEPTTVDRPNPSVPVSKPVSKPPIQPSELQALEQEAQKLLALLDQYAPSRELSIIKTHFESGLAWAKHFRSMF